MHTVSTRVHRGWLCLYQREDNKRAHLPNKNPNAAKTAKTQPAETHNTKRGKTENILFKKKKIWKYGKIAVPLQAEKYPLTGEEPSFPGQENKENTQPPKQSLTMKGIILAGGSATRLYPLSKAISKQIMPVYDKPMIYYPLSTLMLAGIREVLIISTPRDLPMFEELLGDGSRLGMRLAYQVQHVPNGLAQAFVLGKEFLEDGPGCLILGDNLFYGQGFTKMLRSAVMSLDPHHPMPDQPNPAHRHATTMEDLKAHSRHLGKGACIFGYEVSDPRAYGVVEFDPTGKVLSLEEKPGQPKSNYAVPGLYFYDHTVCAKAAALKPSARGEYEITDLNRLYLDEGTLQVQLFGRGFAWLDTGNCDSLLEAGNFIATIQNRQGFYVSCIEEIAWRNGWISTDQLRELGAGMKTAYGQYLTRLAR